MFNTIDCVARGGGCRVSYAANYESKNLNWKKNEEQFKYICSEPATA